MIIKDDNIYSMLQLTSSGKDIVIYIVNVTIAFAVYICTKN